MQRGCPLYNSTIALYGIHSPDSRRHSHGKTQIAGANVNNDIFRVRYLQRKPVCFLIIWRPPVFPIDAIDCHTDNGDGKKACRSSYGSTSYRVPTDQKSPSTNRACTNHQSEQLDLFHPIERPRHRLLPTGIEAFTLLRVHLWQPFVVLTPIGAQIIDLFPEADSQTRSICGAQRRCF